MISLHNPHFTVSGWCRAFTIPVALVVSISHTYGIIRARTSASIRKNYKALPGSPDIVLTKYKIAIFCDSEFFHGKDWEILKLRLENGKNPDFWIKKNRTKP